MSMFASVYAEVSILYMWVGPVHHTAIHNQTKPYNHNHYNTGALLDDCMMKFKPHDR